MCFALSAVKYGLCLSSFIVRYTIEFIPDEGANYIEFGPKNHKGRYRMIYC
jgi:hypothetical protein